MFAPFHLISPSAGARSPHKIRSKLVLPLPFGPVSWMYVPGDTDRSSPLKSLRSPRTQPSLLTSRILVVLRRHCTGNRLGLHARFDGTVHFQPFLPAALEHAHAFEAAGLKDLCRRDARFIFGTGTISDDLSIFGEIFQRRVSATVLEFPGLEMNGALDRSSGCRISLSTANVDDRHLLIAGEFCLQLIGADHIDR